MGYEPEPLPSYIELINRYHTIKFKLHFTLGYSYSLPTSWSHHLIIQLDPGLFRPSAHLIYWPGFHLCRDGGLPSLNLFIGCPNPRGLQYISHQGLLPQSVLRTAIRHSCDPPGRPTMEIVTMCTVLSGTIHQCIGFQG